MYSSSSHKRVMTPFVPRCAWPGSAMWDIHVQRRSTIRLQNESRHQYDIHEQLQSETIKFSILTWFHIHSCGFCSSLSKSTQRFPKSKHLYKIITKIILMSCIIIEQTNKIKAYFSSKINIIFVGVQYVIHSSHILHIFAPHVDVSIELKP